MANSENTNLVTGSEKLLGNASPELKRQLLELWSLHWTNLDHFASSVGARLELVEVSVVPKRDDSLVMEAKVVAEIDVFPGAFAYIGIWR